MQLFHAHRSCLRKFTAFIDEDYPPHMLLTSAPKTVRYVPEDSARYASWAPEARAEWLWTATVGDGNVHLGPNSRLFVVTATHQLHCLRSYREALEQDGLPYGHQIGHLTHCLNFMRMHTLCVADDTLEPPDAFARNHTMERAGAERMCMDWPTFYEDMKENWVGWQEYTRSVVMADSDSDGVTHHHRR